MISESTPAYDAAPKLVGPKSTSTLCQNASQLHSFCRCPLVGAKGGPHVTVFTSKL